MLIDLLCLRQPYRSPFCQDNFTLCRELNVFWSSASSFNNLRWVEYSHGTDIYILIAWWKTTVQAEDLFRSLAIGWC
ncbi:hypothetical protein Pfo_019804 [Paulownia fortunei]|nr:hypothetical protein Pfo_019804 [Paulownia fortunei]